VIYTRAAPSPAHNDDFLNNFDTYHYFAPSKRRNLWPCLLSTRFIITDFISDSSFTVILPSALRRTSSMLNWTLYKVNTRRQYLFLLKLWQCTIINNLLVIFFEILSEIYFNNFYATCSRTCKVYLSVLNTISVCGNSKIRNIYICKI